jgi:hypothetical protein
LLRPTPRIASLHRGRSQVVHFNDASLSQHDFHIIIASRIAAPADRSLFPFERAALVVTKIRAEKLLRREAVDEEASRRAGSGA